MPVLDFLYFLVKALIEIKDNVSDKKRGKIKGFRENPTLGLNKE